MSLKRQFQRMFGPLWASSERGRGLAELMVLVGLYPGDSADRDEMSELLARAGVPGNGK